MLLLAVVSTAMEEANGSDSGSDSSTECPANGDEKWWVFLTTSGILYTTCLALSLLCFAVRRLVHYFCLHKRGVTVTLIPKPLVKLKALCRQLVSGDSISGKILISIALACNIVFIFLAIYRAYLPVERCISQLSGEPYIILELIVSTLLSIFFLVRLIAAENTVLFWLNLYTIVDVFTLPHVFVAITLQQDWLGLKALRFIWLTQITDVLRFIPFIKSQDTVDVVSLLIRFGALWLTSAGIVHLIEASGDPWRDFDNAQPNSFLEYAYFIMVTMSTVGYGDLSAQTDIGKAFVTFFIIGGLAFFAIALPTLIDITLVYYRKTQFAKFDTTRVPRHVIVCGHITATTAEEFLKDFLHPDHGDKYTHILFLHPEFPDQDLRTVLRSYYTRVQYIAGSVLNAKDLIRSKLHSSEACFILANKHCNNPIEEDNANLLRLVSVKNTTTEIPVIIQVLRSSSKEHVGNIPGWNPDNDIALCLNELKLGLLAQSCMCPGVSTLFANLFYTSDFPKLLKNQSNSWQDLYVKGASNEMYSATFSASFNGMKFHQAARICYNTLNLVLIAIEDNKNRKCYINPSPAAHPDLMIQPGMHGYFIGQDLEHVELVSKYCHTCHENVVDLAAQRIRKKCTCHRFSIATAIPLPVRNAFTPMTAELDSGIDDRESPIQCVRAQDSYSCLSRSLESCILSSNTVLKDHIVLCIFADEASPILGLNNFLHPLRNKTIPQEQLKPVVIVTERRFIEKEWPLIHTYPDVYLVLGTPLNWENLTKARVESCSVCIILTALAHSTGHEHAIDDKEAVLCSLSVQKHFSSKVLIITDLIQESNVQFLDISDEDDADARVYMAQPFACGEAFATSMFDSVTTAAFHSPGTLYLVENLISSSSWTVKNRCRTTCQVVAIPISSQQYNKYIGAAFVNFYCDLLDQHCVCLAIYRQLCPGSFKHYVITAPASDVVLEANDIAFVLIEWTDLQFS